MDAEDRRVKAREILDELEPGLKAAEEVAADVGKMFASQAIVLERARHERDELRRRLGLREERYVEAVRLLEYAFHLRVHGENAPGGRETWREFDRQVEDFLRSHAPSGRPQDKPKVAEGALFGRDAGLEWLHPGLCSWPERFCTGHVPSYPPVQVPENTG